MNRTLRADFCGDQMGRCTSDVIRLRSLAHNGWNFELSLPRVGLVIVNLRIGEFNRDISQCRVKHLVDDFSENKTRLFNLCYIEVGAIWLRVRELLETRRVVIVAETDEDVGAVWCDLAGHLRIKRGLSLIGLPIRHGNVGLTHAWICGVALAGPCGLHLQCLVQVCSISGMELVQIGSQFSGIIFGDLGILENGFHRVIKTVSAHRDGCVFALGDCCNNIF